MGLYSKQDKTGEDLQPKDVKGWQGVRGVGQEGFCKADIKVFLPEAS